jgi:hypothetical protein
MRTQETFKLGIRAKLRLFSNSLRTTWRPLRRLKITAIGQPRIHSAFAFSELFIEMRIWETYALAKLFGKKKL